jgi:hypothetical protein
MIYKYKAVPFITKGNLLFPDTIVIDTTQLVLYFHRRENNIISTTQSSIPFKSIAEVRLLHRNEWFFFSGIEIETYGGKIISASGFKSKEAKELKDFLDQYR